MPTVSVARDALFERLGDWFGAKKGQPSAEGMKKDRILLWFIL